MTTTKKTITVLYSGKLFINKITKEYRYFTSKNDTCFELINGRLEPVDPSYFGLTLCELCKDHNYICKDNYNMSFKYNL